jgi:hypothetical protein
MSDLASRISQLKLRAVELTKQISGLADKRKSYAFAASDGDAKAKKAIADVDFEMESLRKEEQTVGAGIESGEALIAQQALDAATAARREREAEAHRTAQAISALNVELDERLKELRDVFERRASLFAQLSNTGMVDLGMIMRLGHKSSATSSAHLAGLGRFLAMEMTPVVAQRPLADSNSLLLGIGKSSSTPRVVLNR